MFQTIVAPSGNYEYYSKESQQRLIYTYLLINWAQSSYSHENTFYISSKLDREREADKPGKGVKGN